MNPVGATTVHGTPGAGKPPLELRLRLEVRDAGLLAGAGDRAVDQVSDADLLRGGEDVRPLPDLRVRSCLERCRHREHRVGALGGGRECRAIFEVAGCDLGAQPLEVVGGRRSSRASERTHTVAPLQELARDGSALVPGGAGNENGE
jgi:hypothetical protein